MRNMPIQKVGKTEYRFSIDPECSICIAVEDGKPIRPEIDRFLISHYREPAACLRYLKEKGVITTLKLFRRHMNKHSSFIEETRKEVERVAEKTALDKIDRLEEFVDADELIQDIITIGGRKIQTGDMEVDSKLLVAALKEQGARKKSGTLRDLLGELDKQRFIPLVAGEIVEEITA